MLLVLLLVGTSVGMSLSACGEVQQPTPTPGITLLPSGTNNYVVVRDGTVIGTVQTTPNAPVTTFTATVLATSCATVETPTPIATSTPTGYFSTILTEEEKQGLNTYPGAVTGVSALQLYEFYRNFYVANTGGWWWQAFASEDHEFSIWDYISAVSYFEASRQSRFGPIMAEAGVRFYHGQCDGYCDQSPVSVLNWWAEFSESAAKQQKYGVIEPEGGGNAKEMAVVGDSFKATPSDWLSGWNYYSPYNWGNLYAIKSSETRKIYKANSHALFIRYGTEAEWANDKAFVVPSGCLWKKGDAFNDSEWQKEVCPAVQQIR